MDEPQVVVQSPPTPSQCFAARRQRLKERLEQLPHWPLVKTGVVESAIKPPSAQSPPEDGVVPFVVSELLRI